MRRRRERGEVLLGLIFDVGMALAAVSLFVVGVEWWQGMQRAHRAAAEGALEASAADGSLSEGGVVALAELGTGLVGDPDVEVGPDPEEPGTVLVRITGRSRIGLPIRVSARAELEPRSASAGGGR